jgi:hypothetical protein
MSESPTGMPHQAVRADCRLALRDLELPRPLLCGGAIRSLMSDTGDGVNARCAQPLTSGMVVLHKRSIMPTQRIVSVASCGLSPAIGRGPAKSGSSLFQSNRF